MRDRGVIGTASGLFWRLVGRKREAVNTLREALDAEAKCCGVDCCDNVIRINDTVTGNLMVISIASGVLKINGTSSGSQGAQGAQGVQGTQGAQGAQGFQGA